MEATHTTVQLVRIQVIPLGRGYIAESRTPEITALGATAEEAVENARLQAIQMLDFQGSSRAGMLLVRLTEDGRECVAMQPLQSGFSLRNSASEYGVTYFDSEGNIVRPREMHGRGARV